MYVFIEAILDFVDLGGLPVFSMVMVDVGNFNFGLWFCCIAVCDELTDYLDLKRVGIFFGCMDCPACSCFMVIYLPYLPYILIYIKVGGLTCRAPY
jgi:hypothetical protein